MKKYIFLITMFVFANNAFAQTTVCVTLPRVHGVVSADNYVVSCYGGTVTINTIINQWEVPFPDDYVDEINEALCNAGLDYIHVYSITYPYSHIPFVFDENASDMTHIVIFKSINESCKNGIEIIQSNCE